MGETVDPFQHWRDALAGKSPPIHAGEPHCGFYRTKVGEVFVAATIYIDPIDGLMHCRVGDKFLDPKREWLKLAKRPIAEDVAMHWFTHGRWPAEPEPTAAEPPSNEAAAPTVESEPAQGQDAGPREAIIGDNSGDTASADPTFDLILRKATVEVEAATEWLSRTKIETQAQADIAGDKISELRKQWKAADAARVVEKQPHLDAERAVDAKWKKVLEPLDAACKALKRAAEAWAIAERERRAAEAAAAAKAAEEAGEPEPPPAPEPVRIGGTTGKRIGFKRHEFVVLTDFGKAIRLKAVREHPDVIAAVEKACNAIFEANGKVPYGCEKKTETRAA